MMRRVAGTVIGVLLYAGAVGCTVWGWVTNSFDWASLPLLVLTVLVVLLVWPLRPGIPRAWLLGVVLAIFDGVWAWIRSMARPRYGPQNTPDNIWLILWVSATVFQVLALIGMAFMLFTTSHLVGYPLNDDERWVWERGLKTVRRQSTLARVARDESLGGSVRLAAAERLTNPAEAQSVYRAIAAGGGGGDLTAVAHLDDQAALLAVAQSKTSTYGARMAAAAKLADPEAAQAVYGSLADDPKLSVANRLAAAGKLADSDAAQALYTDLAHSPSYSVANRLAAAERLSDPDAAQAAYCDVATAHPDVPTLTVLRPLLSKANRAKLAAAPGMPVRCVCVLVGHQPDAECDCARCGETAHDWAKNPGFGKGGDDLYGTCRRCGVVRHRGSRTVPCSSCDGTGQYMNISMESGAGGVWYSACSSCGSTGSCEEGYDDITRPPGPTTVIPPDPAVLSLIEALHTNLANLDPGLEERLAEQFFVKPDRDISGDPDSYNLDMDWNMATATAEARARVYTHPTLPTADAPAPCRPCPNAACPYAPETTACPLLPAGPATERNVP